MFAVFTADISLALHVEIIIPRKILHGTGVQISHIIAIRANDIDGLCQRARLMLDRKDQNKIIVGSARRAIFHTRKARKAGGVPRALIDAVLQHLQSVQLRRLHAANGSHVRLTKLCNEFCSQCGVGIGGTDQDTVLVQIPFTLRKRLRVADHLTNILTHLAPIQVVIVPIYKNQDQLAAINEKVDAMVTKLKSMGISVKYDNADNKRPGFKFAEYELKGVPVRLVMGARDLENNTMEVMRRDTLEKQTVSCEGIEEYVQNLLEDIQNNIYQKALNYRLEHTTKVDTYEEFKEAIEKGGFILAHWDGTPETEEKIKEDTKATIRCIPLEADEESLQPGVCMVTGKPSARRVLFARAY